MKTIEIMTQAEFDALPAKFADITEINISGNIQEIKSTPENSHIRICGGTVSAICGGTVSAIRGGTVSAICGGTVSEIWGGTVSTICGGTVSTICGGTVSAIRGGTVSAIRGGTVSTICGGTVSFFVDFNLPTAFLLAIIIAVNCKVKISQKQKTVSYTEIITKKDLSSSQYCQSLEKTGSGFILYKSVNSETSCDFYSGKIKYEIGAVVTCSDFDPNKKRQCGGGLHLSPTPQMALNYNQGKILVCEVKARNIIVYPDDVTKVRCRKVKVIRAWEGNK